MESVCFEDGTILHIEDVALAKLFKYIQCFHEAKESGGILIGKKVNGREEYYLCDISEPSVMDRRSRFSFVRNKVSAQRIINKKWRESNGIENYMGEWHTHPENKPTPSTTDRELIQQIIKDNSNVFPKVFLIIVGKDRSLYLGIANSDVSSQIYTSLRRCFL